MKTKTIDNNLITANSETLRRVAGLLEALATLLDSSQVERGGVCEPIVSNHDSSNHDSSSNDDKTNEFRVANSESFAHPDTPTQRMSVSQQFLAELSRQPTPPIPLPIPNTIDHESKQRPITQKMGSRVCVAPPGVRQHLVITEPHDEEPGSQ